MVFKRRDRRPIWEAAGRALWPKGGWARAFEYVKHRLRRLPDTPEKIGRGIWAGVLASWTPFYGLHFIVAGVVAKLTRGNILAALLGTFFGNPLTYLPIGVVSLKVGHWILGTRPQEGFERSLGEKFGGAARDLLHNLIALFGPERMEWQRLRLFYDDVFLPYLVGCILPGMLAATICYVLIVPVIRVYQNRRRRILRDKLHQLGKVPPAPLPGSAPR